MNRRRFLMSVAGIGITSIPGYLFLSRLFPLRQAEFLESHTFSALRSQQLASLNALLEHLLPDEAEAPGARAVSALGYLQSVFDDSTLDRKTRSFLLEGLQRLENLAQQMTRKRFSKLMPAQRESVLRALEATPEGYSWLKTMLEFLMEAVLSDPVYGGNTEAVGWQWLHHTPAFPRPLPHKRYFLL